MELYTPCIPKLPLYKIIIYCANSILNPKGWSTLAFIINAIWGCGMYNIKRACSNVAVTPTNLFAWGIRLPLCMKKWHGQALNAKSITTQNEVFFNPNLKKYLQTKHSNFNLDSLIFVKFFFKITFFSLSAEFTASVFYHLVDKILSSNEI